MTRWSCCLVSEAYPSLPDLAALRVKEAFMSDVGRKAHWENVYTSKGEREVSWYQESPAPSLERRAIAGLSADASIIDTGGGPARLVEAPVDQNIRRLTLLAHSAASLDAA